MSELSLAATAPKKALALVMAAITVLGLSAAPADAASKTATPIKHLVVIFQENVSFDHYFGTYPNATNPPGEPVFKALPNTPTVNGYTGALLNSNPNLNPLNAAGASNPFRLDRSQPVTPDQGHGYLQEQQAFDHGLMDLFPQFTSNPSGSKEVMGYYDGNTVTAMWNYAQFFAMNDNSYSTTFGPSTPGLINLVSGQTNGVANMLNGMGSEVDGGMGSLTVIGDPDPIGDVCSSPTRNQVTMRGNNIGDLLRAGGVTWGSFMGGFDLTVVNPNGSTGCQRSSINVAGATVADYIPHHQFFNYWISTANLKHTRPASLGEIGNDGPANHQYDVHDFFSAVSAGNFPAVSFLKAPAYQDGHAGYSDPVDEQTFLVNTINFLQAQPSWKDTAVVILYDDSDGWYDHQIGPIVNTSTGVADALTGTNACGTATYALPGIDPGITHALGRCGYGPRQPFLVVSPWARQNFVDHSLTDQTSVIRFIEDNWLGGERIGQGSFDSIANSITQMFNFRRIREDGQLFLNPNSGNVSEPNSQ